MFNVSKANHLLQVIDRHHSIMTIYDDSEALRAAAEDTSELHAMSAKMAAAISISNLPTRTSAASVFLNGDRRRQPSANGGANTALTGTTSTVRREGLSAIPARLHPILIRGGTYDEAVAAVELSDSLATRDARLAASMSHVPPEAAVGDFWESRLKLSKILYFPDIQTSPAVSQTAQGYVHSVAHGIYKVKEELKGFTLRVENVRGEAASIVYCDTKASSDALRDKCNADLDQISVDVESFTFTSGLATLSELHRMRVISEYSMALLDIEEWLHSHSTIHHAADRPLDEFECFVIGDCIHEERLWANSAENVMAPIEEFQIRTKMIADLRQSEQEHRTKKVQRLSDLDPGLLLHTSEKNKISAETSRRFQMLQHLGKRALNLRASADSADHSAGQRAKAHQISDYVLGWIAEITENGNPMTVGRESTFTSRPPLIQGRVGGTASFLNISPTESSVFSRAQAHSASVASASQRARSQRLSQSVADRSFARFVSSGAADGVDVVSRASTEEIADQLSRVILAFKENGEGAGVVARRNELEAVCDYIRSSLANPTLNAAIDVEELERILEDLAEWEAENPDGASAAGYVQIIDTLRDSASKCGLSVLADYNAAAYATALTTKTPSAGVAPTEDEDQRGHSARPPSSVTLFRQFTADRKAKTAKKSDAPIFDAINSCCDVIEAIQQLRVHVRAKGRTGGTTAFLADKVAPLQVELAELLEGLEGLGTTAKEGDGTVGDHSVNALVISPTSESEDDNRPLNEESVRGDVNQLEGSTSAGARPASAAQDFEGHPLILRLSMASESAVNLLKEAKNVLEVQVPASCWILTHAV